MYVNISYMWSVDCGDLKLFLTHENQKFIIFKNKTDFNGINIVYTMRNYN